MVSYFSDFVILLVIISIAPSVVFLLVHKLYLKRKIEVLVSNEALESRIKLKKNYPTLSIVGIMRNRKKKSKYNSIYFISLIGIFYLVSSNFLGFNLSIIFLFILFIFIIIISLELFIFNYRVNQGWYGSSESEAREIIDFIIKNSEDIDFTDGNRPKSIIKPEDIKQVVEELGIHIPGYPEPNIINRNFSEG